MNLSHFRTAAVFIISGCSIVPVTAQTSPTDTYLIKRVFKAGDIDRYKMKMDITIKSPEAGGKDQIIKMNMLMKETVKSVSDAGLVTVIDEYPKAEVGFNGQTMDIAEQVPKITITKDASGHITAKADGSNENANKQFEQIAKSMFVQQANSMPKKPVKVGDSWTPDTTAVSETVGQKITATLKLDAMEMIGQVKVLKLVSITDTSATAAGTPETKVHSESTTYLDANTFKLVKMIMKGSGIAAGNNMQTAMTVEPATAEDEKGSAPAIRT